MAKKRKNVQISSKNKSSTVKRAKQAPPNKQQTKTQAAHEVGVEEEKDLGKAESTQAVQSTTQRSRGKVRAHQQPIHRKSQSRNATSVPLPSTTTPSSTGTGTSADTDSERAHFKSVALAIIAVKRMNPRKVVEEAYEGAKRSTAKRTGFSLRTVGKLLVAALVCLLVAAATVVGPRLILGVMGFIDLDVPPCDGTQFFFQCECKPGFESDQYSLAALWRKEHCSPCEDNEFKAVQANTKCQSCPAGKTHGAGHRSCKSCGAGHFRASNEHRCHPCPRNTYKGKGSCVSCGLHEEAQPGSRRCTPAPCAA